MSCHHQLHVAHVCPVKDSTCVRLQPLEEHLRAVAALAEASAAKAGLPLAGRLVGMLHDFGKYSKDFQSYILSAGGCIQPGHLNYTDPAACRGTIDHTLAGGQHIRRRLDGDDRQRAVARMLALCVLSHHGGLKDCLAPDGKDVFDEAMVRGEAQSHHDQCAQTCPAAMTAAIDGLFSDALVQEVVDALDTLQARLGERLPQDAGEADRLANENSRDVQHGLVERFLLSCLVDADRTDSAECEDGAWKKLRAARPRRPWGALVPRLEAALAAKTTDRPPHSLDALWREVAVLCARRSGDDQGIFTLTAPAGAGQTLASLRFAVRHAQKHGLDRVVYVMPSAAGVDQNAAMARAILEQDEVPGSIVLDDQAGFLANADSGDEGPAKRWETLTENWEAPVVFTTMARFLESLFGAGAPAARRMHNLARSVIVFDAVDTLPLRWPQLFCDAVDFLVGQCGASVVLCAARQPGLGGLPLGPERELVPDEVSDRFRDGTSTAFFDHGQQGMTADAVAALAQEELRGSGSCLVVCNTQTMAARLFALCPAPEGLHRYFLSADLCPAHRLEMLAAMRDDLDAGRPVLCVSPPCLECDVDFSFRSVIRPAAGPDAILQTAGRCNRHGAGEPGRVHAVRLDGEAEHPDGLRGTGDENAVPDMLGSNRRATGGTSRFPLLGQSFGSAAAAFTAINAATTSLLVPYGEGKRIIAALGTAATLHEKKDLLRRAQRYAVPVLPPVIRALVERGAAYALPESGILVLHEAFYDNERGVVTPPAA